MANERSGDSITQYLTSLFLFAGTWLVATHYIRAFEIDFDIYTWFFSSLLVAFLVSTGAFVVYNRLKVTVGAKLGLLQ